MPVHRHQLPQLKGRPFLTDGGLETSLVFLEGVELPGFAAFPLILHEAGRARLRRYFEPYLQTAVERRMGFVLDTPTWRANPDWGARLGFSQDRLDAVNRISVQWAAELRDDFATIASPVVINGVIGPRGDGYRADNRMTADEAQDYHSQQIATFSDSEADMVSALTMNYAEEAMGIVRAAQAHAMPAVISFTVETDGRLASGEALDSAITRVDAATNAAPAYYMINCAHPEHFEHILAAGGGWTDRIGGIRANASRKSHAELDEAEELDAGDPKELGMLYERLRTRLNRLGVLGGCCGTDHRHIVAICDSMPGGNAPADR